MAGFRPANAAALARDHYAVLGVYKPADCTPEEALAGATRNAARALGVDADRGTLEVGKLADLAVWNIEQPAELSYWAAYNPLDMLIQGGTVVDFEKDLTLPGVMA